MDSMLEAYKNVRTQSKKILDESSGNQMINNINKLSVALIDIGKELKEHVRDGEELQELSETIRVNLNKLKQIVEQNTGL